MGMSLNTSVSPLIRFSRRVSNDIEEQQRKALTDSIEGTIRGTNTFPFPDSEEQEEEVITPNTNLQATKQTSRYPRGNSGMGVFRNEDTGIKQVHTVDDQNPALVGQNTGIEMLQKYQISSTVKYKMMVQILNEMMKKTILICQMMKMILICQRTKTSKVSHEDNYHTAIDDDNHNDTI